MAFLISFPYLGFLKSYLTMKKLFVFALVTLSFVACKKTDTAQHCWSCYYTRTFPDANDNFTTVADTNKFCDMTADEMHHYEGTHQTQRRNDTTYSDTHCLQQPDK